jgi:hypothetical protein
MRYSLLSSSLSVFVMSVASAQPETQPGTLEQRIQPFKYSTADSSGPIRRDRFCLPRSERLVRVTDVLTNESNSKSNINIRADTEANCVNVEVLLPPPRSVCTDIPRATGITLNYERVCDSVPTTVSFAVKYEALKLPENPFAPNSSRTMGAVPTPPPDNSGQTVGPPK